MGRIVLKAFSLVNKRSPDIRHHVPPWLENYASLSEVVPRDSSNRHVSFAWSILSLRCYSDYTHLAFVVFHLEFLPPRGSLHCKLLLWILYLQCKTPFTASLCRFQDSLQATGLKIRNYPNQRILCNQLKLGISKRYIFGTYLRFPLFHVTATIFANLLSVLQDHAKH